MTFDFYAFIHFVFIGFVALFPVINPLGSAFIISPYFAELSQKEKIDAVKRIALYAFFLCLITLLTGKWILELFGLSIPIIQLAGGIMICKLGWNFLSPAKQDNAEKPASGKLPVSQEADIESKLFYPITFPITTGAGTISVLFTLSAHGTNKNIYQYLINTSAILLAVIGMCILIFLCYTNANRLIKYLGSQREKIINNIMAFLIFCVGLQIAVEGISQLIQSLSHTLHQAG
jgi:multiple antibiotic resistance protein